MGRAEKIAATLFTLLLGITVEACASSHGGPTPPSGELPCDVNVVMTTVCQQCHASPPQNQAPFPLVKYADTQIDVSGKPLWTYMLSALESGRMPLPPVQLSDADRDTLLVWLRDGAPARALGVTCASPTTTGMSAEVGIRP